MAKVVGNLTTVSANPTQTYRITILNSPNVNAFALPGGYLYVTRGLLALANDSAELAAVIAHEMGHVTANHGLQRQQKEAEEGPGDQGRHRRARRQPDRQGGADPRQAQAGAVLAQPGTGGRRHRHQVESARPATTPMPPAASCSRWRPTPTSARSAAPPTRASTSWPAIPTRRSASSWPSAMPASSARRGVGTRDRDSFLAGIDGLLYGDTPEEGYVRGNTFLHPGLGISFSVPDGFVIDNSAAAVTATGPGDMAIRFDGVSIDTGPSLDRLYPQRLGGRPRRRQRARRRPSTATRRPPRTRSADGWQFDITVDPRRRPGLPAADRRPARPARRWTRWRARSAAASGC